MTHPEYRSTRSALTLGVAFLGLMTFLAGCDTVAEISFQNRNLSALRSTGFISMPGSDGSQCGTLGNDRQAEAALRFVLLDDQSPTTPFIEGEGSDLDVNQDIRISNLSGGRVFEPEDVACEQDAGDCDVQDYRCENVLETGDPSDLRCNNTTNFDIGSIRFLSDDNDELQMDNAIGLVVEHGATTRGSYPSEMAGRWYDSNEDGQGDRQYGGVQPERASDERGNRLAALGPYSRSWTNVADVSEGRDATTYFGLWALNNGDNVESAVNAVDGTQANPEYWSTSSDQAYRDALGPEIDQTNNLVQPLVAVTDLINGPYRPENNDKYEEADKTLVLVVDGPPELPLSASNLDLPQDLIDAANDNNVSIHIVHFDPPFDDLSLFPDSQPYWDEQSENCSSDQDCQDWETCREVNGFSDNEGENVSPEPSGTYCMPERRDEDGRYGPISVYGEIACATEGSYQYIKSPFAIQQVVQWLPYATDGLWEAGIQIDRVNEGEVESNGPTRVQANFEVEINGSQSDSVDFSQQGLTIDDGEAAADAEDNRSTIFIGDLN